MAWTTSVTRQQGNSLFVFQVKNNNFVLVKLSGFNYTEILLNVKTPSVDKCGTVLISQRYVQ